jgi:hypothetical protein
MVTPPTDLPAITTNPITTETAIKLSNFSTKASVDDVTDNDKESPVWKIAYKFGYAKTEIELESQKKLTDYARQSKRLDVIKFIFGALIGSIPALLMYLMAING